MVLIGDPELVSLRWDSSNGSKERQEWDTQRGRPLLIFLNCQPQRVKFLRQIAELPLELHESRAASGCADTTHWLIARGGGD